jgi:hypothetical protein
MDDSSKVPFDRPRNPGCNGLAACRRSRIDLCGFILYAGKTVPQDALMKAMSSKFETAQLSTPSLSAWSAASSCPGLRSDVWNNPRSWYDKRGRGTLPRKLNAIR